MGNATAIVATRCRLCRVSRLESHLYWIASLSCSLPHEKIEGCSSGYRTQPRRRILDDITGLRNQPRANAGELTYVEFTVFALIFGQSIRGREATYLSTRFESQNFRTTGSDESMTYSWVLSPYRFCAVTHLTSPKDIPTGKGEREWIPLPVSRKT
jgi:hypothetical protein